MFEAKNLNYGYSNLEPFIDTHTMGLHYQKHYKNYLNKLNELLRQNNITDLSNLNNLEPDIKNDILFNLGGVINHELYFESISPVKKDVSSIKDAINKKYGNYENFKKIFTDIAMNLKGSGYTFLVLNNNELEIMNFSNQDSPSFYGLIPLLNIDLWEHAYYINYENRKKDYIDNFFNIVNFSKANEIYEQNINKIN